MKVYTIYLIYIESYIKSYTNTNIFLIKLKIKIKIYLFFIQLKKTNSFKEYLFLIA